MALFTELQQHVTTKVIINQLMKSQVSVVTSFTTELLDSLETLQCRQNKPLYVFPYGEKVKRNSLTQVSRKKTEV
jgi:predicted methyltransferase